MENASTVTDMTSDSSRPQTHAGLHQPSNEAVETSQEPGTMGLAAIEGAGGGAAGAQEGKVGDGSQDFPNSASGTGMRTQMAGDGTGTGAMPPPAQPAPAGSTGSMGPPPPRVLNTLMGPPQSKPKTNAMGPTPPMGIAGSMGPPPPKETTGSLGPPTSKEIPASVEPPLSMETTGSMGPPISKEVAGSVEVSPAKDTGLLVLPPAAGKKAGKPQLPPAPSYTPPSWAGVPEGIPYSLEVLKSGSIVQQATVGSKPFYTFGRHPSNDWCLEHPSVSRLHAVLVYNGSTGEAFLFDVSSTHGTLVNKKQIKSKMYVPLRVGDTFKLGSSSRLFILGGPSELMPEEGLSREQKKQLAQLHAAERQRKRELELGAEQMSAAMGGGASWGFGEDAVEEEAVGANIDWRSYAQTHALTDHQRKMFEKIRKAEYTINSLRDQMSRIQAKEKNQDGGLTVGQAKVLVDAEVKIEQLTDEMEDWEEMLMESIAHSISGKTGQDVGKPAKKKRKGSDEDDSNDELDSDDEFYDRTGSRKRKKPKGAKGTKVEEKAEVENAATLHGKRSALLEEKQGLEAALEAEQAKLATDAGKAAAAPSTEPAVTGPSGQEGEDSLDAFMSNIGASIEQDKVISLKSELADISSQLQRVERLLAIADPSGLYNPNKQSAQQARARVLQLSALEQKRKAAAAQALAAKSQPAAPTEEQAPEQEEENEDVTDNNGHPPSSASTTPIVSTHRPQARQRPTIIPANPNPLLAQLGPARAGELRLRNRSNLAQAGSTRKAQHSSTSAPSTAQAGSAGTQQEGTAGVDAIEGVERRADKLGLPKRAQQEEAIVQAAGGVAAEAARQSSAHGVGTSKQPVGRLVVPVPGGRSAAVQQPVPARSIGVSRAQLEKDAAAKVAQELSLLASRRTTQMELGTAMTEGDSDWKPPENQTGDGRTRLNDLYGY